MSNWTGKSDWAAIPYACLATLQVSSRPRQLKKQKAPQVIAEITNYSKKASGTTK